MYTRVCVYEQMDTCYIQRWYKFKASISVVLGVSFGGEGG